MGNCLLKKREICIEIFDYVNQVSNVFDKLKELNRYFHNLSPDLRKNIEQTYKTELLTFDKHMGSLRCYYNKMMIQLTMLEYFKDNRGKVS